MYHIFFIHSSVDGHLSCFHVLAIINSAAINIGVPVSFQIMAFSGYMPKSRIAGSYGSSIFSFLRNFHTILHSSCTNLHFHQWCRRIHFSPHPLQHLLFVDFFLMMVILTCNNFIVVLICISLIMSDVEHLFICFLATHMSSLENVYFDLSLILGIGLFDILYWVTWAICIFRRLISCQLLLLQLFSPRRPSLKIVIILFMVSFAMKSFKLSTICLFF